MCMVLMMAGLKKDKLPKAWEFIAKMVPIMSRTNDDGVGYAGMTKEGKLFSERWLNNKDFGSVAGGTDKLFDMVDPAVLVYEDDYEFFGDPALKTEAASIILHTRHATTPKGIVNTHPFIRDGAALIHNGTISNHLEFKKLQSTCDSEVILNEYIDYEVNKDPENIEFVSSSLEGSFAVGVLSTIDKKPYLDVFKNSGSTLYATYIEEIGTAVFCTSEWSLKEGLGDLKWKVNKIVPFANNHFIRLDVVTGTTLAALNFPEEKKRYTNNSMVPYSAEALGIELETFASEGGLAAIVTEFHGDYEQVI